MSIKSTNKVELHTINGGRLYQQPGYCFYVQAHFLRLTAPLLQRRRAADIFHQPLAEWESSSFYLIFQFDCWDLQTNTHMTCLILRSIDWNQLTDTPLFCSAPATWVFCAASVTLSALACRDLFWASFNRGGKVTVYMSSFTRKYWHPNVSWG